MTTDFNSINDITSWYQEVLWALKLDSFHLIGASRGGWFAMDLALNSKRDDCNNIIQNEPEGALFVLNRDISTSCSMIDSIRH